LPGGKGTGAQGLQPYHFYVLSVWKSRSLNLLDPSGLVQACAGIAPPLHLHTLYRYVHPEIFQIV